MTGDGVLPPFELLEERNKYFVGRVMLDDQPYFIKTLKDPDNLDHQSGLANEVDWNTLVGTELGATSSFETPASAMVSPTTAAFEFYDSPTFPEGLLEIELPTLAAIFHEIETIGSSLTWDPNGRDLVEWYRARLMRVENVWRGDYFPPAVARDITKLLGDSALLGVLKPGLVHGDFNLKNLLMPIGASRLVLVDSEFGAEPSKPAWYKPRREDAAYFYHLLVCQYQLPELAAGKLAQQLLIDNFSEPDFEKEFALSLLEKTLSMMNHFVVSPKIGAVIDDVRRTEPEPYIWIVQDCLNALKG